MRGTHLHYINQHELAHTDVEAGAYYLEDNREKWNDAKSCRFNTKSNHHIIVSSFPDAILFFISNFLRTYYFVPRLANHWMIPNKLKTQWEF